MTSTFAATQAASRATVHASTGVRALAIVGKLMQGAVVLPPRSPGPGRP